MFAETLLLTFSVNPNAFKLDSSISFRIIPIINYETNQFDAYRRICFYSHQTFKLMGRYSNLENVITFQAQILSTPNTKPIKKVYREFDIQSISDITYLGPQSSSTNLFNPLLLSPISSKWTFFTSYSHRFIQHITKQVKPPKCLKKIIQILILFIDNKIVLLNAKQVLK